MTEFSVLGQLYNVFSFFKLLMSPCFSDSNSISPFHEDTFKETPTIPHTNRAAQSNYWAPYFDEWSNYGQLTALWVLYGIEPPHPSPPLPGASLSPLQSHKGSKGPFLILGSFKRSIYSIKALCTFM